MARRRRPDVSSPSQTSTKQGTSAARHDDTAGISDTAGKPPGDGVPRLIRNDEIPPWYEHNEHIRGGYRPVLGSVTDCLRSLRYLHNESVNIYSHLVPAAAALVGGNCGLAAWFWAHYPGASAIDRLVFHGFVATSTVCFAISSAYHTFLCHSERYYAWWIRMDYVSIVLQIMGSFFSGIYVSFYCEPVLQTTYWIMISSLGLLTCFVVLNPFLQHKKWRLLRLFSFIGTGLSAFAPIIHAATLFPYEQLEKQAGLRFYYLEGALILLGCAFYATNFPESWRPGGFDIWGASHQIFHVFVVLGAVAHMYGIATAFEWNYQNPRCRR